MLLAAPSVACIISRRSRVRRDCPSMYATQSPAEPLAIDRPWPLTGRLLFRLAFAYYALFIPTYLTGYIEDVPGGGALVAPYNRVVRTLIPWIGKHVLRLGQDITVFTAA